MRSHAAWSGRSNAEDTFIWHRVTADCVHWCSRLRLYPCRVPDKASPWAIQQHFFSLFLSQLLKPEMMLLGGFCPPQTLVWTEYNCRDFTKPVKRVPLWFFSRFLNLHDSAGQRERKNYFIGCSRGECRPAAGEIAISRQQNSAPLAAHGNECSPVG